MKTFYVEQPTWLHTGLANAGEAPQRSPGDSQPRWGERSPWCCTVTFRRKRCLPTPGAPEREQPRALLRLRLPPRVLLVQGRPWALGGSGVGGGGGNGPGAPERCAPHHGHPEGEAGPGRSREGTAPGRSGVRGAPWAREPPTFSSVTPSLSSSSSQASLMPSLSKSSCPGVGQEGAVVL